MPDDQKFRIISGAHVMQSDREGSYQWLSPSWTIKAIQPIEQLTLQLHNPHPPLQGIARVDGQVVENITLPSGRSQLVLKVNAAAESEINVTLADVPSTPSDDVPHPAGQSAGQSAVQYRGLSNKRSNRSATTSGLDHLADGWFRLAARQDGQRNDSIHFSGLLCPPALHGESPELMVEGGTLLSIEQGLTNQDHAELGAHAFEAKVAWDGDQPLRLSASQSGSRSIHRHQDWVLFPPAEIPLPPTVNQQRVAGETNDLWFTLSGGTFVGKIPDVMCAYDLPDPRQLENILDWGCGCGRLTRHLPRISNAKIHAADIDAVNVEWIQQNLSFAEVSKVHPRQPLPYADASLDLVIGHSVLTHLDEPSQFFWLAELQRALRPGGVALLTTMGGKSVSHNKITGQSLDELNQTGILDVGHQDDGVDLDEPGFYRTVYHRSWYIEEKWSEYFEILDILSGYADHQDLVVCRKR